MKAAIITIGNSKGIRIPKPLLEESGLVDDVDIKLLKDGLKITPVKKRKSKISKTLLMSQQSLAKEWDTAEEDESMGIFAIGDVVTVPFPFTDLSSQKLRPAVVVAKSDFNDLIFSQITSKDRSRNGAVKLTPASFKKGKLNLVSFARPDKLFTGDASIIVRNYGSLNDVTKHELLDSIKYLFSY